MSRRGNSEQKKDILCHDVVRVMEHCRSTETKLKRQFSERPENTHGELGILHYHKKSARRKIRDELRDLDMSQ